MIQLESVLFMTPTKYSSRDSNVDKVFDFNFKGYQVRAFKAKDGKIWFVANDVAKALGYKNVGSSIDRDVEDINKKSLSYKALSLRGKPLWTGNDYANKTIINESGVYELSDNPRLKSALPFRHWLLDDVVPKINHKGVYATNANAELKDLISKGVSNGQLMISICKAMISTTKERDKMRHQLTEQKPKVDYANAIGDSKYNTEVNFTTLALKLNQAKIFDGGSVKLGKFLRMYGLLSKQKGRNYNQPPKKYSRWFDVTTGSKNQFKFHQTLITQLGQEKIIELLTKITKKYGHPVTVKKINGNDLLVL